ncbi:serine-threonine kinase receptor-associated protein [Lutzomyia longipalpis]|uniref:serine-threonine kinase receptor-associated protein n=1 Tax=Lutzomyia longipalpis TaxID=7200 RepID=UPI002483F473|nr:serine-threonine kinase receptor-associated protein [Lutzomyia longipalpis]
MSNIRQISITLSGHTRPVVNLDFSDVTDCGYFLISACKDGNPMLRQGDTGDWVGTFEGHKGAVWGVTLNGQATLAASGAADFSGKVWNAITGELIHSFMHKHIVKSVAFDSNCEHLVTGSNEKLIQVFNLANPTAESEKFAGHTAGIKKAIFCRNDKCILSCADDKSLRLWDRLSGKEVQRIDFASNPQSLELSCDRSIVTLTSGNTITFLENETLNKVKEIVTPSPLASASLHPDKHFVVCGGDDFKLYKYDYVTGNEIDSFKGHFGPVHAVKFSPDGELFASGSEDGTLRLWQTTVGKTYGLWKCTEPTEIVASVFNSANREVSAS